MALKLRQQARKKKTRKDILEVKNKNKTAGNTWRDKSKDIWERKEILMIPRQVQSIETKTVFPE